MSIDLDLLKDEPMTPEQAADYVAEGARGFSIKGIMLRGYEVSAYDFAHPDKGWTQLTKHSPSRSGLLAAEREAKWWFNREQRNQDDREKRARKMAEASGVEYTPVPDERRAIRIRYIVSLDPTTIEEVK